MNTLIFLIVSSLSAPVSSHFRTWSHTYLKSSLLQGIIAVCFDSKGNLECQTIEKAPAPKTREPQPVKTPPVPKPPQRQTQDKILDVVVPDDSRLEKVLKGMVKGKPPALAIASVKSLFKEQGYMEPSLEIKNKILYVRKGKKHRIVQIDAVVTGIEQAQEIEKELKVFLESRIFPPWRNLFRDNTLMSVQNIQSIRTQVVDFFNSMNLRVKRLHLNYKKLRTTADEAEISLVIVVAAEKIAPVTYEVQFENIPPENCLAKGLQVEKGKDVSLVFIKRMRLCGVNPAASVFTVDPHRHIITVKQYVRQIIEHVYVVGTRDVDLSYLARRYKGKPASPLVAKKLEQELARTGVFTVVDVALLPSGENFSGNDLLVRVKEMKRASLNIGAGVNTLRGLEGELNFTVRKLFHTSASITLEGGVSYLPRELFYNIEESVLYERRGRLTFEKTNLIPSLADLYAWVGAEYKLRHLYLKDALFGGVTLGLTHQWLDMKLGYDFELRFKVESTREQISESGKLGKAFTRFAMDLRDDRANPSRGGYASLMLEMADRYLGSKYDFVKITWNGSLYIPMQNNIVMRLFSGSGCIWKLGTVALPVDEYYYIGGSSTVRGVEEESFVPNGAATAYAIYNVEFIMKLFENMSISVFNDGGIASGITTGGVEIQESIKRLTVGFGMRYRTPVGPMRLEIGFNTMRKEGEPSSVIHFSIGATI